MTPRGLIFSPFEIRHRAIHESGAHDYQSVVSPRSTLAQRRRLRHRQEGLPEVWWSRCGRQRYTVGDARASINPGAQSRRWNMLSARRSEQEKPAIANGEEGGMDAQKPQGSHQVQHYISMDATGSQEHEEAKWKRQVQKKRRLSLSRQ